MKTYVWTLPSRLIHWLMVAFIVGAFILGGEDQLIHWHALAGLSVGFVLLFRIVWGITGPRYARFSDFVFTLSGISRRSSPAGAGGKNYAGHNLAASWVMAAIYFTLMIVVATGFVAWSAEVFGPSVARASGGIHEGALAVLWILTGVHLTGVVISFANEREVGVLPSIFTGYKNIIAPEARVSTGQKVLAWVGFLLLCLFVLAGIQKAATTPVDNNRKTELRKEVDNHD